jgi:hypothetical protein
MDDGDGNIQLSARENQGKIADKEYHSLGKTASKDGNPS